MLYVSRACLMKDIWQGAKTHSQLSYEQFYGKFGNKQPSRSACIECVNKQAKSLSSINYESIINIAQFVQYFLLMIFNSISKEINHNYHPTTTPKYQQDYQTTHFFQRDNSKTYSIHKTMDYQVPQRGSALSQMNQKITSNIEYLKYKDYMRQKDLHSSRVSNTSNQSHRSIKTLNSQTNSRVSLQSPSRGSHIPTKKTEHYFPQLLQTKLSQKPWQTQATSLNEAVQLTPTYQQRSGEYREFLRKPITIENYNEKYGLNKKYEDLTNSKQENVNRIVYKSNISQRSKPSEYPVSRPDSQFSQQTFASPISKDFTNIFDKQPKLKPQPQPLINAYCSNQPEKSSSRVVCKQANQMQQKLATRSPLEVSQKNNRTAVITAAGLIGLGIVLLILQVLK